MPRPGKCRRIYVWMWERQQSREAQRFLFRPFGLYRLFLVDFPIKIVFVSSRNPSATSVDKTKVSVLRPPGVSSGLFRLCLMFAAMLRKNRSNEFVYLAFVLIERVTREFQSYQSVFGAPP